MPRGVRKTPVPTESVAEVAMQPRGPELDSADHAKEAEALKAALAENNALVAGAQDMLNRIAAEKDAKADEPSGIEVGTDWGFMHADPSDPAPYLAQKGKTPDKGRAYAWLNSDKRVIDERLHRGWKPVEGGTIRRGDLVLADRPVEIHDREQKRRMERVKLFESAPSRQLDQDGLRTGMPTFTGNKSAEDGLK